jgi:hypothetical protein
LSTDSAAATITARTTGTNGRDRPRASTVATAATGAVDAAVSAVTADTTTAPAQKTGISAGSAIATGPGRAGRYPSRTPVTAIADEKPTGAAASTPATIDPVDSSTTGATIAKPPG